MNQPTPPTPIPVTIIAGFLGAGKTTLLNHILAADHGLRLAVLVNDFGQINIDTQVLEAAGVGGLVNLPNGCICCTLFGSLVSVFQKLIDLPKPPAHIIIEASGVSKPHQIAGILDVTALRPHLALDGIITLVDAENVRRVAQVIMPIAEQIAAADLVIVNKVDLITDAELRSLEDWLLEIAPAARILTATYAQTPLELLLGSGLQGESLPSGRLAQHDHHHDIGLQSWHYAAERPFKRDPLAESLAGLPAAIYRAKGFVYLADAPAVRHLLQLVGSRVRLEPFGTWPGSPPRSELVFIGRPDGMNGQDLQRLLDGCCIRD